MSEYSVYISLLTLDARVAILLEHSLGRIWRKQRTKSEELMFHSQDIRHYVDWLTASVFVNAHWLSRCDGLGRPLKLMKLGSLEACLNEADKTMRRANTGIRAVQTTTSDEQTEAELADGYTLVRLLTPLALDQESRMMSHCIGHGSYDHQLSSSTKRYLSLRDPSGKAHATLEIDGSSLIQLKGKQNCAPIWKYIALLQPYIISERLALIERPSHTGLVQDRENRLHSVRALPDGLNVEHDLSLEGTAITALPKNIKIGGSLLAYGNKLTSLPPGLEVGDWLHMALTPLASLPTDLKVGGAIILTGTAITSLPENFHAKSRLLLNDTRIAELPNGLKVDGDLDISNTPIKNLPFDLKVGGNLTMNKTLVTQLPDNLHIPGDFDVSKNFIAELPKGLKVGGSLTVSATRIEHIPDDIEIGRHFDLGGTKVTVLPEDLVVNGNLDIRKTDISALPERLKVHGDLRLQGTKITQLPRALEVAGDLVLTDTLVWCLPERLTVGGDLVLRKSAVRMLARRFFVRGKLKLDAEHRRQFTIVHDDDGWVTATRKA